MITFNVRANNGNYYRGHEPSNSGNCWSDEERALVMTIQQARKLVRVWPSYLNIVISVKAEPITDEQFERELFCASGGSWYLWPHIADLQKQLDCEHETVTGAKSKVICSDCAAAAGRDRRWYDPRSGTMLDSKLKSMLIQWKLAKKKSERSE